MEDKICPNQPYGQHITVRCSGCNSIHSTKNIGSTGPTGRVYLDRSLFDILGTTCVCQDTSQYPLVHICEIDDNLRYVYVGPSDGKFHIDLSKDHKHIAGTPEARKVLQDWWLNFIRRETKLDLPTQEDLDDLVLLEEVTK